MSDPAAGYPYQDFYYMKNGNPSKWRRLHRDNLPAAVAEAHAFNCFFSVQQFSAPTHVDADEQEMHYAPPYADFDDANAVENSQTDMRKLVQFLKEELDLDDSHIRIWFSGSKGFHVVANPLAFGVQPMLELTYVYKAMFAHIAEYLGLPTLDMSVYTKRRMWRVPNTVHAKTNLYKRELDHDEITLSPDDIRDLAREPRRSDDPVVSDAEWSECPAVIPAQQFFQRFRASWEAQRAATDEDLARVTLHPEAAEGDPVCVQDIMRGIKKTGDRNKATLALGGYYKDVGRPLTQAVSDIKSWALALPAPAMRNTDDRYVAANTASVLKTVYGSDSYHFSCRFIRSLHGPKTSTNYERVACAGDACPFINGTIEPESVVDVHLSQIGDPSLLGKQVRTRMRVAGRQDSAYLVPSKVVYRAIDDDAACGRPHCLLHQSGGRIERNFAAEADTRTLLSLCGVNDQQLVQNLRRVIERVSCKSFYYDVEEHVRVIEMTAVPKAESFVYDPSTQKQRDEAGGDFVYQRVYAVGMDFKVNAYYEVTGRVFPHPRHQEATLVITDSAPTQDAIEDFDLDVSRPMFKAYEGETADVLGHLVADMAVNVVKVAGRQPHLLGLLMALHSPLEMQFEGERYGGWLQMLMIGDTGEAKSQLVERLIRYVGLGELLSAQSSGRTGLLYTIITKDTTHNFIQWGAFVLNDRRLLVIDEASGIDKSGYAELRNARRDGVFKVSRSVSGEAQTRTRLIVLSNPRWGKNMSAFSNGIEAVEPLFEHADIRRFDLVAGFRNGSVPRDLIDEQLGETVEHVFDRDTMRANILWAWSRTVDDIFWTPGTAEKVKAEARRLNKKYEGSDIHLLSQDGVEKIARMAQALAATLHSTDTRHEKIVVLPIHVELVASLIDTLYSAQDLDYELYVKQNHEGAGDVDYDAVMETIRESISYPYGVPAEELIENFQRNKIMNSFAMEAMSGDSKDAKAIARQLFKLGLIQATRNGFEPTTRFKELIRIHNRQGSRSAHVVGL